MKTIAILTIVFFASLAVAAIAQEASAPQNRQDLAGEWTMQSSFLESAAGADLSQPGRAIKNWHRAQVPTTVLKALTKAGVYPDMRVKVTNPTGQMAFFLQLELAQGRGGNVDGMVKSTQWAWARERRKETIAFPMTMEAGKHQIEVGGKGIEVPINETHEQN